MQNIFIAQKRKPIPISSHPPWTPIHNPWQPLTYFLSLQVCWIWALNINGLIWCVILCDWLLSFNIIFLWFVHVVAWSIYQDSYYWIVSNCMDIPLLFGHPSIDGNLGCLHFLAIMNNVDMNIHIQIFLWAYIFNFHGYINRNIIARSHDTVLNILQTGKPFSKVFAPFYNLMDKEWGF